MLNDRDSIITISYEWNTLANEMSTALRNVYDAFSQAFTEGKLKPEGAAAHHTQIFTEIWEHLDNAVPQATSLEALHKIYDPIEKKVNDYIEDYCEQLHVFQEELFPEAKKSILYEIVRIHYALNKQRFLLLQFRKIDTPGEIIRRLDKVEGENEALSKKINMIAFEKTEREIHSLYELARKILSTLLRIRYINEKELNITFEDFTQSNLFVSEDEKIVLSYLQTLPISDEFVAITDHLKEAVESSRKENIAKYQADLAARIQLVDDVQEELKKIISGKIGYLLDALQRAVVEYDNLKQNFSSMGQKSLLDIFSNILRMNGYKLNNTVEIKGYSELRDVAFDLGMVCKKQTHAMLKKTDGFLSGLMVWKDAEVKDHWSATAEKVGSLLTDRANSIEKFLHPYHDLYAQAKQLQKQIFLTSERLNTFDSRRRLLAMKLAKAEHVWCECYKIFDHVKSLMLSHIKVIPETDGEYLRSFLLRHWGKIGIGGSSGGGLGTALYLFALAAHPWLIPLSVITGGGMGVLTGMAMDRFPKKPEEDDQKNERKPLLGKKQTNRDVKLQTESNIPEGLSHLPLQQEETGIQAIAISPSLVYQSSKQSNASASWWPRWTYGTFWSTMKKSEPASESLNGNQNNRRYQAG